MKKKAANSEVRGGLLFENRSLVDFQIGNEQKGCQMGGSIISRFFPKDGNLGVLKSIVGAAARVWAEQVWEHVGGGG